MKTTALVSRALLVLGLATLVAIAADSKSSSDKEPSAATAREARMTLVFKSGALMTIDFIQGYGTIAQIENEFRTVAANTRPQDYAYQSGNPNRNGRVVIDLRELAGIKREELPASVNK